MSKKETPISAVENPKTELDELDRWRSYSIYMEAMSARNAFIALQNKIGFHDAERRAAEAQVEAMKTEVQTKEAALKKELAAIQTKYNVPEGWGVDLSTGKIMDQSKQAQK